MNPINLVTDAYERKARLYPALLLIAPVVAATLGFSPAKLSGLQALVLTVASCGGVFLLTQLARDAGKKGEKALFKKWGGTPSVAIFRHRDIRLDTITKARYHKKLASLVKEAKAPSPEQEQADSAAADAVYTAWSNYLRVNTRDSKKFPLLFQENLNYGYRRNVWGLRPIGFTVCLVIALACVVWLFWSYKTTGKMEEAVAGAGSFAVVLLLLWTFRFNSDWVRIPADAYAERLVECVDTLGTTSLATKK